MKTREDVAKFINNQFHGNYKCSRNKGGQHHYGIQELRELMDFIFDGAPSCEKEEIFYK